MNFQQILIIIDYLFMNSTKKLQLGVFCVVRFLNFPVSESRILCFAGSIEMNILLECVSVSAQ